MVVLTSVTILTNVKTIPLGRRITKSSDQYYIILPVELNELWSTPHENEVTVKVYRLGRCAVYAQLDISCTPRSSFNFNVLYSTTLYTLIPYS